MSVGTRDALAIATVSVLGAFELTNAVVRPVDFVGFVPTSVMLVLAVYVAVPFPFVFKPWILLVEVVGLLWIVWTIKEAPTATALTATSGLIAAWLLGAWVAIQLGRSNRVQYLALAAERSTRVELESAMSEIKELRGILPICSSRKRVRDDEGFWQQVEVYVEEHSDAQFSHGTCPPCIRDLYPAALPTQGD